MVHMTGRGSREDLRAIVLETRKKQDIPNEVGPELLPQRMAAAVRIHLDSLEERPTSFRRQAAYNGASNGLRMQADNDSMSRTLGCL